MCHRTLYTLPCGHVEPRIVHCHDATESAKTNQTQAASQTSSDAQSPSPRDPPADGSQPASPAAQKQACPNMTTLSVPYPAPPSAVDNPASYSASPLFPRCPLPDCPFEQKNRCWDCCWCGKDSNSASRCSSVMLFEGNKVPCEHLCCPQCRAARDAAAWQGGGFP